MSIFWQNTKNEYFKLLRRKKYLVFLIIEVAICVAALFIQVAANGFTDGRVQLNMGNLSLTMLTFFIMIYIPLVVFMAAGDLFSAEMGDNSIKAVLVRPISRGKVFFSKTLAVVLVAAHYLVALLIVTTIIQIISNGSASGFFASLCAYLLDILPMIVLVFMAVALNQMGRSGSMSMFLCILVYAIFYIVGILVPVTYGLFFTGYMQWHKLWLGAPMPIVAMLPKIGILLGCGLVFGGLGYYIFEKRDF